MEKKSYPQLELFSQGKIPVRNTPEGLDSRVRKYEKTLLIVISFIITVILSFALGVEKGKQIMVHRLQTNFDVSLMQKNTSPRQKITTAPASQIKNTPVPPAQNATPPAAGTVQPQVQPPEIPQPGFTIGSYTIQIASYKTKAHAQKEIEALKKKGQPMYLVSKGGLTILCIGSFTNKESAKPLLSELRKNYQDCFLRRL